MPLGPVFRWEAAAIARRERTYVIRWIYGLVVLTCFTLPLLSTTGISSARELGSAEKQALEAQIAKTTGKKVRASYGLDASLLGGAVVRIGSTIYDGSVKGQLERIREQLAGS